VCERENREKQRERERERERDRQDREKEREAETEIKRQKETESIWNNSFIKEIKIVRKFLSRERRREEVLYWRHWEIWKVYVYTEQGKLLPW
jgi:hypothetical protein